MSGLDFDTIEGYIAELLEEFCALGRNGVAAWRASTTGIELIIAPKFLILQNAHKHERVVIGPRRVEGPDFETLLHILDSRPIELSVGNLMDLPANHQVIRGIEAMVRKHSIIETPQRAATLYDIVNFSLLSPVQQVAQLNSLECSISAGCKRVSRLGLSLDITRSNTGDGFYVWNHEQGLAADLALYYVTILTLCENALELERSTAGLTPIVRTCFHCGGHYSYYQMGQSKLTDHDYIVGDLTIILARMSEVALPGQILVGDFLRKTQTGEEPVGSPAEFITKGAEFFGRQKSLAFHGQHVDEIRTYLTGEHTEDDRFYIDKLSFKDKHSKPVSAFNAKANFHRANGKPLLLGLQHAKLTSEFTVEHIGVAA